jgi:hypothetical protein
VIDGCDRHVDRRCRLASLLLLSRCERTQLNAFSGLCNPLMTFDAREPISISSAAYGGGVQCSAVQTTHAGLEIDHVAAESMEGLLERFGQGGMGVDVAHQFVNGEIPALCECEFG